MKPVDLENLRLALPGVAKCQPLSFEDVQTIARKAELRDLASRIAKSTRRAAKRLRIHEATLRGLSDPRQLNRCPKDSLLERARNLVESDALRASAARLEEAV